MNSSTHNCLEFRNFPSSGGEQRRRDRRTHFKISYADLSNAADGQKHFDGQKDAAGVLPPHRGP